MAVDGSDNMLHCGGTGFLLRDSDDAIVFSGNEAWWQLRRWGFHIEVDAESLIKISKHKVEAP